MLAVIHPALVHFPIALLVVGGIGEAAGLLLGRDSLARFGGILVVLGHPLLPRHRSTPFLHERLADPRNGDLPPLTVHLDRLLRPSANHHLLTRMGADAEPPEDELPQGIPIQRPAPGRVKMRPDQRCHVGALDQQRGDSPTPRWRKLHD